MKRICESRDVCIPEPRELRQIMGMLLNIESNHRPELYDNYYTLQRPGEM